MFVCCFVFLNANKNRNKPTIPFLSLSCWLSPNQTLPQYPLFCWDPASQWRGLPVFLKVFLPSSGLHWTWTTVGPRLPTHPAPASLNVLPNLDWTVCLPHNHDPPEGWECPIPPAHCPTKNGCSMNVELNSVDLGGVQFIQNVQRPVKI